MIQLIGNMGQDLRRAASALTRSVSFPARTGNTLAKTE